MVSKNNQWQHLQASAQRVPHFGLRKLSVGVASVLLSTTLYMGVNAHADTVATLNETVTPAVTTVTGSISAGTETTSGAASGQATAEKPVVRTLTGNAMADAQPTSPVTTPTSGAMSGTQSGASQSAVTKMATPTGLGETTVPAGGDQHASTQKQTTLNATVKWFIHYTDETGKKLVPDSVITHDYTRTDTGDQMGDWSYVPGSVKVTGTPNNGWLIDNPTIKFDQSINGGPLFDGSTWQAAAATVDGYTPNYGSVSVTDELPKNPESLHATSMVDMGPHEYTFVYTKQPTKVTINYVDDEQGEKVVGTGTVSGKSGTDVTIMPQLPKGYMLTPDKDVPSTYTVTNADNQTVTIHVQKQFVDLSDTDPQAKQTRTITLHYVYGVGDKQGQSAFDDAVLDVYYHRTATLDRATNQTTYGDWMWDKSQGDTTTPGYHVVSGKWTNLPQSWANVTADVPSIKGWYADLGQNDPTNTNHVPSNTWVFPTYNNAGGGGHTVDGHSATAYLDGYGYEVSPIHTIKYIPNQTTVTVNYVDDDNNGVNVGHQSWNGTTGQHIDLTLTPPENYVLTPGWINPSSYDFDGVNSSWYTVHVKHATQDVTDQQPKDQVTKVTRLTRNHLYGDGPHKGEKFAEPDIFDLAWKRTATKDLVTNKVTFGNWQVNWDDSKSVQGQLTARPVPYQSVDGMLYAGKNGYSYMGSNSHSEFVRADGSVKVNGWNKYGWQGAAELEAYPVLNYYYGPGQVNIPVYYIDADTGQKVAEKINDNALTGNDFRDGNTVRIDQSKLTSLPMTLAGYQLLPGQTLPTSYKIDTFAGVKAIEVQVVKDRSVKITFVDDDNKEAVVGTPTTITGHTGGDSVPLDLTVPDKYQLVNGQQLPTTYTFTKGSGDVTIHLAKDRSVKITFVDDDYNGAVVGTPTTIIGHTGGDPVVLDLTVPENYKLADGQQLPTSYTFIKGSGDVTIHLVHQIVQREATIDVQLKLVTAVGNFDFFVTTQAQWAQLKDKTEYAGSETIEFYNMMQSVEVGTLTGYVNYDLVDKRVVSSGDGWTSLSLNSQTYQLPNGTDVVNGVVVGGGTYGLWGKNYKEIYLEGLESLPNVDPDYINLPWHGYLSVNATSDPKNYEIANIIGLGLQAGLVGDEPNALAKANGDHAATGVETTNKTVDLSLLKDANPYLFDSIYNEKIFSEQDGRLQAKVALPVVGVYVPYVEKTTTRTINVTTPDGKTTTVKQNATLAKQFPSERDTHPAWTTGEWASYDAPAIPGYTASQANVAKETVAGETEDQTVNITYTANPQTTTVVYQTEDGTPVHMTTVDGKTGQTVKVSNEVPMGWRVVDGKVPSEITFGPDGAPKTVVTIDHSHVTVTPDSPKTPSDKLPDNPDKSYPSGVSENDLNKTVTRTIKVTTPDGQTKTITQTAKLTRTADVDEVTGEVKYSDWATCQWDAYTPEAVPGYTPSINEVPKVTVDGSSSDQTVALTYTPNMQTVVITFMDQRGNKIGTPVTVSGRIGETVKVNDQVPDGWKLYAGQALPTTITLTLGTTKYDFVIKHLQSFVSFDQPKGTTDLVAGTRDIYYPSGLSKNDLTKTITRTIKDGDRVVKTQSVTFVRNAVVDVVTGEVTYLNWSYDGEYLLAAYVPTPRNGYTVDLVKSLVVTPDSKSSVVDLNYQPVVKTVTVNYVDASGKVIQSVTGVTKLTAPTGYRLMTSDTINVDDSAVNTYNVLVEPVRKTYTVHDQLPANVKDLSKVVTRTVKIEMPNGHVRTIKQEVRFERTATVDANGTVTYSDYHVIGRNSFNKVFIPHRFGYKLIFSDGSNSVAKIGNVNADAGDTTIVVKYVK